MSRHYPEANYPGESRVFPMLTQYEHDLLYELVRNASNELSTPHRKVEPGGYADTLYGLDRKLSLYRMQRRELL
jgi:hypothetical protein